MLNRHGTDIKCRYTTLSDTTCGTRPKICVTMKPEKERVRFVYNRRKLATPTLAVKVELEIYFSRNSRKIIPTDILLLPHQWRDGRIVNHPNAHSLTVKLEQLRTQYEKTLLRMEANGDALDLQTFNECVDGASISSGSFLDYMYDRITTQAIKETTRRRKLVAYNALRRFGRIRSFASVTAENINRFDLFLRDTDPEIFDATGRKIITRSQVTLHGYHKDIKPYILEAHRLGYIKENPYNKFKDVRGKSKERNPLTHKETQTLIAINLPPKLAIVRDLFIFCAHTGLSYSDMMKFNYDTDAVIRSGFPYIDGERLKTGSRFFTPILPAAMTVLERYQYKLPKISLQKYNDYLHVIEEKAGFNKPLTSHLARHTFATLALNSGVPIEVLARMLGHSNISVTQIYAKILTSSIEQYAAILRK